MRKGYFSSQCFDNLHFSYISLFYYFYFSLNTVKDIYNSWNQTCLFPLWRIQGMEDESWKTSGSGLTLSHSSNSLFPSSFSYCNKYKEMVSAKVICFLWLTFFLIHLRTFSIFCIIGGKLIKGWNLSTPPENLHWLFIHSLSFHHNRNFIHCLSHLILFTCHSYIHIVTKCL